MQVKDDKEMYLLKESIEKYGILNPLIVRPVPDGVYEIISGHRRKHVAELLGYRKVPVIIREECGDSPKQVQRYISLTRLIPEFLQKLDDELISFNPAVEVSYLKEEEQKQLLEAMDYAQAVPSLSQAQRIRKLSKENQLTLEKMQEIMSEIKKGEITRVAFTNEQLHKYFPSRYTPAMMKWEIIALLKSGRKKIGRIKWRKTVCVKLFR